MQDEPKRLGEAGETVGVEVRRGGAELGAVSPHSREAGRGPPAVLLHGIPETSHAWRHVVPRLAPHHRVVAPDLRDLGDSSRPRGGDDKATVAEDAWRLLDFFGEDGRL